MMETFLIETPDGKLCHKTAEEIQPDDKHILDGTGAFDLDQQAQAWLEAEIAAAGGLAAWRDQQGSSG